MKKVTEDYEALRFNTAISQLMVFVNEANKQETLPKSQMVDFIKMLSPVAPHLSEELWEKMGMTEELTYAAWPTYDESKLVSDTIEVVIQVNGKLRAKMHVSRDASKEELEAEALGNERVQEFTEGKTVRKVIVVPGKLVNIVVG